MLRFTDLLRQELSGQTVLFSTKNIKGKNKVVDDTSKIIRNDLENVEVLKKLGKLINYWKENVSTVNNKDKSQKKN